MLSGTLQARPWVAPAENILFSDGPDSTPARRSAAGIAVPFMNDTFADDDFMAAVLRWGEAFMNAAAYPRVLRGEGCSRSVRNRDVSPAASMDGFTAFRERPSPPERTPATTHPVH